MRHLQNDTLPSFIFYFPVFFVFHGFVENFPFISVTGAILLIVLYTSFSMALGGIFFLANRNMIASALLSCFVMSFHFFFGAAYDFLKLHFSNTIISKYSFIITLFIFLTILLFLFFKKKKPNLSSVARYCNLLFPLLILLDIGILSKQILNSRSSSQATSFSSCDSCNKPDIYIIILDGYAGVEQLQKDFNFSNSSFIDTLSKKGFKVFSATHSNYNYTPFSTAATLDMAYLDSSKTLNNAKTGNEIALKTLYSNRLVSFLRSNGYTLFNYSIFNIDGQASPVADAFVPSNTGFITANTFTSRFKKTVLLSIAGKLRFKKLVTSLLATANLNNKKIYELTIKNAGENKSVPKIVYTHLLMPHHPYYYSETGKKINFESASDIKLHDREAYLSYLKYTNREVTRLVDSILTKSSTDPIIALFSDHGFRYNNKQNENLKLSNLVSLYTPSHNYSGYKDSITNVNFFRMILNNEFKQNLPLLNDKFFFVNF